MEDPKEKPSADKIIDPEGKQETRIDLLNKKRTFALRKKDDSDDEQNKRISRKRKRKKMQVYSKQKIAIEPESSDEDDPLSRSERFKVEEEEENINKINIPTEEPKSNKIFGIKKMEKKVWEKEIEEGKQKMIDSKRNPLKDISKIIFNKARTKKTLQIPQEPFRIYVENMGHYSQEKAAQTKNAINYHKPAVAVILETNIFYHKGFITFAHEDSKQKMIVMIRRDLIHEIQIFKFKNFPIIKTWDTMFCIVHSVPSTKQHIRLPNLEGRVVYLGDFNVNSVAGDKNSNLKDILEMAGNSNFEATWEIGYIAHQVKGGATFIDQSDRDHQAMIYAADFREPLRKLVPNAGKIHMAARKILDLAVNKDDQFIPFTRQINTIRGIQVRAKPVFSNEEETEILKPQPSVWERIKSSASPFVNASEIKKDILDSLRDYFQRYKPKTEKVVFTQKDYEIGFYLFAYFTTRSVKELRHSNARDRNGVAYGDLLNATIWQINQIQKIEDEKIKGDKIKRLFDYFWFQFTNTKFTYTKCFLTRKKDIITEHKHLRMLSIQDSMWKLLEVIFQPVTWICNRIAINNIPGTFGFVSGGATYNAFLAKCPQVEKEQKLEERNLNPTNVEEEDLDAYLEILDKELEKKNKLKEQYDITEFLFT